VVRTVAQAAPPVRRRRIGTRQSVAGSIAAYAAKKREAREEAARIKEETTRPLLALPLTEYANDPVGFIHDIFGVRIDDDGLEAKWVELYPKQQEICRDIVEFRETAVTSGNGVGKSFLFPLLAWWWVCTRVDALVILTSSVERQITEVHWEPIRTLWLQCRYQLGPEPSGDVQTGWRSADRTCKIFGYAAKKKEDVQGTRRKNTLVLCDESSGVPDPVNDGFNTLLTGDAAKRVNMGNPTKGGGWYYELFQKKQCKLHSISCLETPNLIAGRTVIPGLVDVAWVEDKRKRWGTDDPRYKIHVLGQFLEIADAKLFPSWLLKRALVAAPVRIAGARRRFGLDIAGAGDDETVLVEVQGTAVRLWSWSGLDLEEIADRVKEIIGDDRNAMLHYDATGIGFKFGKLCDGIAFVRGVHFGAKAREPKYYASIRDELPWDLRGWMKAGGQVPDDPQLREELEKMQFRVDAKYKNRASTKDEIRKAIGRSPDRYDALCLATYGIEQDEPVAAPSPVVETPFVDDSPAASAFTSSFSY
jgi:hypothetical protein